MIASSSFHGRDIYLLEWRRLSIRSTRSFTSPAEYASFGKQQTALFDDGKKSDNTSFPLRSCRNAALASEVDQILKGARLQRRPRASPDHRGLKCSAAAKAPSTKTTAAQLECQSGMQSPRGSRSCYQALRFGHFNEPSRNTAGYFWRRKFETASRPTQLFSTTARSGLQQFWLAKLLRHASINLNEERRKKSACCWRFCCFTKQPIKARGILKTNRSAWQQSGGSLAMRPHGSIVLHRRNRSRSHVTQNKQTSVRKMFSLLSRPWAGFGRRRSTEQSNCQLVVMMMVVVYLRKGCTYPFVNPPSVSAPTWRRTCSGCPCRRPPVKGQQKQLWANAGEETLRLDTEDQLGGKNTSHTSDLDWKIFLHASRANASTLLSLKCDYTARGVPRSDGARSKFGAPTLEPKVFRKQTYCVEDILRTIWRPQRSGVARGIVPPLSPLVTPLYATVIG